MPPRGTGVPSCEGPFSFFLLLHWWFGDQRYKSRLQLAERAQRRARFGFGKVASQAVEHRFFALAYAADQRLAARRHRDPRRALVGRIFLELDQLAREQNIHGALDVLP